MKVHAFTARLWQNNAAGLFMGVIMAHIRPLFGFMSSRLPCVKHRLAEAVPGAWSGSLVSRVAAWGPPGEVCGCFSLSCCRRGLLAGVFFPCVTRGGALSPWIHLRSATIPAHMLDSLYSSIFSLVYWSARCYWSCPPPTLSALSSRLHFKQAVGVFHVRNKHKKGESESDGIS